MAISTVGSLVSNATNGSYLSSLSVTPATVGDLLVAWAMINNGGGGDTYTSISGGGVTTWNQVSTTVTSTGIGCALSMWWGAITTAGSTTITLSGSNSNPSTDECIAAAQEFTIGGGSKTTWAKDGTQAATKNNTTSSTTIAYPTLTPSGTGRMYVGGAANFGTASSPTSGYTLTSSTGSGSNHIVCIWDTSVAQSAQSPTCSNSSSAPSCSVAILLTGSVPATPVTASINRARLIRSNYW